MNLCPNICVLVITYNQEKYVERCLQSLVSQSLKPKSIIVADDHSDDNTWPIILKFKEEYPDIFEVHRAPSNVGAAKNDAFLQTQAKGDFTAYIEGDDYWSETKLEYEYKALEDDPDAMVAYSNVTCVDTENNKLFTFHDPDGSPLPSGDLLYPVLSRRIFNQTRNCFRNYLKRKKCRWKPSLELPSMGDYNQHIILSSKYKIVPSKTALPQIFYRQHASGGSQNSDAVMRAAIMIYENNNELISRLNPAEELDVRLSQEMDIVPRDLQLPKNKQEYYAAKAVYTRCKKLFVNIPKDHRQRMWTTLIDRFRLLLRYVIIQSNRQQNLQKDIPFILNHLNDDPNPSHFLLTLDTNLYRILSEAYIKSLKEISVENRG